MSPSKQTPAQPAGTTQLGLALRGKADHWGVKMRNFTQLREKIIMKEEEGKRDALLKPCFQWEEESWKGPSISFLGKSEGIRGRLWEIWEWNKGGLGREIKAYNSVSKVIISVSCPLIFSSSGLSKGSKAKGRLYPY